jgi:hypothetical protein
MRIIQQEDIDMPEFRTFTCSACAYKADVTGFAQTDCHGTYETLKCNNCKILIDSLTEESVYLDSVRSIFLLKPINPVCYVCDESNTERWDVQTAKCPKCDSKMNLTRLIIKPKNFDMDSIQII